MCLNQHIVATFHFSVPHGMDNSDDHIWFGRVIDGVLRTYWVLLSEVDAVDDYINKSPLGVQEAINSLYIGNDMLSLKSTYCIILICMFVCQYVCIYR